MSSGARFCFSLVAVWLMHYAAFAQSTSESVAQLRTEADACMADFVHALKSAGDDSKYFFDGDVLAKAETSKTDLESLVKKIDEQTDVLSKKEVAISSKSLPDAEKKELLGILAEQKNPLQDLKGRIAIFQQKLVQFTQADASRWKETFQSFESISGTERAQEKLKAEIATFLKAIPFLKDLEKSPSSAWKKKASTAQSTPSPLASPRTEGKGGIPQGPSLQLQGGISIGETSHSEAPATYTVVAGDTLRRIALQLNTSIESLEKANNLTSTSILKVGQTLVVGLASKSQAVQAPITPKSATNNPAQSAATPKAVNDASLKEESFFQFPRWFVVGFVLSVLIIIWGTSRSSDALMGLGWISLILLVPIWLIWLIYLWVLRVIASW